MNNWKWTRKGLLAKSKAAVSVLLVLVLLLTGIPFYPGGGLPIAKASTDMHLSKSTLNPLKGETVDIIFSFNDADNGQNEHQTEIGLCEVNPKTGTPSITDLIRSGKFSTKDPATGAYVVHTVTWDGKMNGNKLAEGRYTICVMPEYDPSTVYYGQISSIEIVYTQQPAAPTSMKVEPGPSNGQVTVSGIAEAGTTVDLEVGYSDRDTVQPVTGITAAGDGTWHADVVTDAGAISHIAARASMDGLQSSYSELMRTMRYTLPSFPVTWEALAAYYYKTDTIEAMVEKAREIAALNKVSGDVCPDSQSCPGTVSGLTSLLVKDPLVREELQQSDLAQFSAANVAARSRFANPTGTGPVDLGRGDFVYNQLSMSLQALMPIQFGLNYLSREESESFLGKGWHHSYEWRIEDGQDNHKIVVRPDGARFDYVPLSGGKYYTPRGTNLVLTRLADSSYTLESPQHTVYTFNADQTLAAIKEANGNSIQLSYGPSRRAVQTGSKQLQSITTNGAALTLTYDTDGHLTSITDQTNRQVKYDYDPTSGDMIGITLADGAKTSFEYDANHRVAKVKAPLQTNATTMVYDSKGRVTGYTDGHGVTKEYTYIENSSGGENPGGNPGGGTGSGPVQIDPANGKDIPDSDQVLLSGRMNNERNAPAYLHVDGLQPVIDEYMNLLIKQYDQQTTNYSASAVACSSCDAAGVQAAINGASGSPVVIKAGSLNVEQSVTFGSPSKPAVVIVDGINTNKDITVTIYGTLIVKGSLNANTKLKLNAYKAGTAEGSIWVQGDVHLNNDSVVHIDHTLYAGGLTYNSGQLTVDANRIVVKRELSINTKVDMNIHQEMVLGTIVSNNQIANLITENGDIFVRDQVHVNNNLNIQTGGAFAVGGDFTPNQKPAVHTGIGIGKSILTYPSMVVASAAPKGKVTVLSATPSAGVPLSAAADSSTTVEKDTRNQERKLTWNASMQLVARENPDGTSEAFIYDGNDNVTSVTNRSGDPIRLIYDEQDALLQQIDEMGQSTTIRNTMFGKPRQIIDAKGGVQLLEYNAAGDVVQITDAMGHSSVLTRDAQGVVTSIKNAMGEQTEFTNDAQGFAKLIQDPSGYVKELQRDALHRVENVKDALGTIQKTEYDERDRVDVLEDSLGQRSVKEYDLCGNLIAVTDAAQAKTRYTYDEDRLMVITDPEGHETTFTYDDLGRIKTRKDANGGTTAYSYDSMKRVIETADPENGVTKTSYDANGNVATRTDAEGGVTRYTYNKRNQLLSETDAAGATTAYKYDVLGRLIQQTNALGNHVWYDYDASDRMVQVTDNLNQKTKYEFDDTGRLTKTILPNGSEWVQTYDVRGLTSGTVDPEGKQTKVERDARGRVTKSQDKKNNSTTYEYNDAGQVTRIENALGYSTLYSYDPLGRVKSIKDANHRITKYDYDRLGRLQGVTDALNQQTAYSYDAVGNLITKTDARQNVTSYSYNKRNQVIEELNALNQQTKLTYDENGNLASKLSPDNQQITYQYDPMNRLTQVHYAADSRNIEYKYDLLGRRSEMKDDIGTTQYSYDSLNRLTEVTDAKQQTIHYEWTATGQRSRVFYPDLKAVSYEYDKLDRIVKVTDTENNTTTYSYDENGQLSTKVLPNHGTSSYQYDALGQLLSLVHKGSGGELLEQLSYVYDPVGNRKHIERQEGGSDEDNPSGAQVPAEMMDYTYDALNQLTQVKKLNGPTTSYTYDPVGNRLSKENVTGSATESESYVYDQANKLTHWEKGTDYKDYSYDLRGNLLRVEGQDSQAGKAILSEASMTRMGVASEVYGSLKANEKPDASVVTSNAYGVKQQSVTGGVYGKYASTFAAGGGTLEEFEWNSANQLTSHRNPAGDLSTYSYDGDGNRMQMTVDLANGLEQGTYPSAHPAGQRDGWEPQYKKTKLSYNYTLDTTLPLPEVIQTIGEDASKWKQTYAYGAGQERISMSYLVSGDANNDWEPIPGISGSGASAQLKTLYYLNDGLGSAISLTNQDGRISARYHYDEFGIPQDRKKFDANWPGPDNQFGYTGLGYDAYDGMTHARARYYNPSIGRFISEDTYEGDIANPLTLNLYTYVSNNPLTHVDPTGHMKVGTLNLISQAWNIGLIPTQGELASRILIENGLESAEGIKNNTVFHELAQVHAAKQIFKGYGGNRRSLQPALEVPVPDTKQEADIVYKSQIWEVKPLGDNGEAQISSYTEKLGLARGSSAFENISEAHVYGNLKMGVYFNGPGLVNYELYLKSDGIITPVTVPEARTYANSEYERRSRNAGIAQIGAGVAMGVAALGAALETAGAAIGGAVSSLFSH